MTDTKQTFDFKEVDGQVAMTIVDVKQALKQLVFRLILAFVLCLMFS